MLISRKIEFDPVDNIKMSLGVVLTMLKNDPKKIEHSKLFLFLLVLYKEGLIENLTLKESKNLKKYLGDAILLMDSKKVKILYTIYQFFEETLGSFPEKHLQFFIKIFNNIDRSVLRKHFPEIFDDLLFDYIESQGRYGGEYILPTELSRFVCGIVDRPSNAKVYNPFGGIASFGVFLGNEENYLGQELNQSTWILGVLRIVAHERGGETKFIQGDSINNWLAQKNEFDFIIANPPFGLRLPRNFVGNFGHIQNAEHFLIEKGIDSINEKGKLIVVVSNGFLFRSGPEQNLRQYIVENDLLEMVISLPSGLLNNTGISLVILVFNKNKKISNVVKFIDAKTFLQETNEGTKKFDDSALNSAINKNIDTEHLKFINKNLIREYNYSLNVPRYFQKEYSGTKLENIASLFRGNILRENTKGHLIRIRDLIDDKINSKLKFEDIEIKELTRHSRRVDKTCILLALRWRSFKPTLFEYSGIPIYITPDIVAIQIDESKVDAHYLINELQSEYVKEQADIYRVESVIPTIRKEDLLSIKIQLPSLQEQKAKISGIRELSDKILTLQKERNALAHGKSVSQYNEFASLKHTIGRPRQNILGWSKNMIRFFDANRSAIEKLNSEFKEFYSKGIIEALEEIKSDINFITDVLEKGEGGFVLEEYEKTIVSLSDINSIIYQISNNDYNFIIKKLIIKGEKLRERGIIGNKILFRTLLDNLLTNANKYGFDKKELGNEVVVELTVIDEVLVLEVKNNGKPFPKNFDREKFITKYSTANSSSGSGLGGYDVHRIASYFDNTDWLLSLNEDRFYPVKFKFQFPIKLIS